MSYTCPLTQLRGFHRRREITLERKKAAEERRRSEEEKTKVFLDIYSCDTYFYSFHSPRWVRAKLQGCDAEPHRRDFVRGCCKELEGAILGKRGHRD